MAIDTRREAVHDAERDMEHDVDELEERVSKLGDDIDEAKTKAKARRDDASDDDDDDAEAGDPSAFDDPEEDDDDEEEEDD
jgi:vacuolar-type H+-ATPase subunit H